MKSRYNMALIYLTIFISIFIFTYNIFTPVVYDNDELQDTYFILSSGWRFFSGFEPNIDYGHFYGGILSKTIGLCISIFGPDVKVIHYGLSVIYIIIIIILLVIASFRLSMLGVGFLALTAAVLIFTRHPLEYEFPIIRIISTHSFIYNRIGLAILLVCGAFAVLPSRNRVMDSISGVCVGGLLVVAALAKPTFIVLAPAIFLALCLQFRWRSVSTCLVGFILGWLVLDPWGERWFASYAYVLENVSHRAESQVLHLLRKAVQIPLADPAALGVFTAGVFIIIVRQRQTWPQILSLGGVMAAGFVMAATMGGAGSLVLLGLPLFSFGSVVLTEIDGQYSETTSPMLPVLAVILVGAFCVPHIANLVGASAEALALDDRRLIHEGPMARYVSVPNEPLDPPRADQYEMLADGIEGLAAFGDMRERGIIADNGVSFEFALLAKPVPDYPLWPRAHSPEFADGKPIPPGTDFVLLGRGAQADDTIGPILREKMGDGFLLCKVTAYWDIYARITTAPDRCPR